MKRKFVTVFFIVALLSASICSAQGVYKNFPEEAATPDQATSGSILRGTGDKPDLPDSPGETGQVPVGSGLGVLFALSGAYMLVKKKKSSRK